MSRIAKYPVELPKGVEFRQDGNVVTLKGGKGELSLQLNSEVELKRNDNLLSFAPRSGSRFATAVAGTMRSIVANMAQGVSEGFERKLELVGVGYRAQAQGKKVSLSLGFSHPVEYTVPNDITIETPSQTEIVIRGADKQQVGQVAAEIRRFRPPEPYKGKGVRYAGERVVLKEAKKK
jgi:large subunit ribosomal protein L6